MLSKDELTLLGSRLKELRQARDATAAQVAHEALGYPEGSHVAVTRLERGVLAQPRVDHLQALATYYGVEPSHLFVPQLLTQANAAVEPAVSAHTEKAPAKPRAKAVSKAATLAERIQLVRSEMGLDTTEFAQGLSRHGALILAKDVERWEADEGEPNPIQLRAVARLTERSESWFRSGLDTPAAEPVYRGAAFGLGWGAPAAQAA